MPMKLAQQLITRGLVPAATVEDALRRQAVSGGTLDTVLLERAAISEGAMLQALSDASGLRLVNLADFEPNHEVAALVPAKITERLNLAPLSVEGSILHIASTYPVPTEALKEVGFLVGKQIEAWVALECRVRDWISAIYQAPLDGRHAALLAELDPGRPAATAAEPPALAIADPVESSTLEESLTRDMVEQLAQSVIDEPILLELKKPAKPAPPSAPTQPEVAADSAPASPDPAADPAGRVPTPPEFAAQPAPVSADPAANPPGHVPTQPEFASEPADPVPTPPRRTATQPEFAAEPGPASWDPVPTPPRRTPTQPAFATEPADPVPTPPSHVPTQPEFAAGPAPGLDLAAAPPKRPKTQPEFSLSLIAPQHEPWRVPEPAHSISLLPKPLADEAPAPLGSAAAESTEPEPWTFPAPASAPLAASPCGAEPWAIPPPAREPAEPGNRPTLAPGPPASLPGPTAPTTPTRREPWATASQATGAEAPVAALRLADPPGPPPASAAGHDIPDWTLAEARQTLKEASCDRQRIIDAALRYARRAFDFTAAFAVVRGAAVGWDARGDGAEVGRITQVSIPLDAASVFRTVAITRGSYVGPLPADALSAHFLGLFGRAPRTLFICPIEVKSRLVAILYGDSGSRPMSQRRVSDFILFCQDLPAAFQELLVSRKQRSTEAALPEAAPESMAQPAEPSPMTGLGWGGGWSPSRSESHQSFGRAVSMPALVLSQLERPPPDFAPILRRLLGPDAARRSRAMAELARTPEASARVLANAFPGPTAWSRLPVVELPEADELGPIPAALSRLGRAGAQALAPLLDSPDTDTRYLALLAAGNLAYAELVDGVLRGLFDFEPDLSSAARAAVTAFKHLPRFDSALKDLRLELQSHDPLRRSLAARALGCLHDRESIDGLIELTRSDDQMCTKAASDALWEITRVAFGPNPTAWSSWWVENRSRHRIEWLVAALRHPDLESRMAAIEELAKAFNDTLGYLADGSEAEREAGARRWQAALAQSPRGHV